MLIQLVQAMIKVLIDLVQGGHAAAIAMLSNIRITCFSLSGINVAAFLSFRVSSKLPNQSTVTPWVRGHEKALDFIFSNAH